MPASAASFVALSCQPVAQDLGDLLSTDARQYGANYIGPQISTGIQQLSGEGNV